LFWGFDQIFQTKIMSILRKHEELEGSYRTLQKQSVELTQTSSIFSIFSRYHRQDEEKGECKVQSKNLQKIGVLTHRKPDQLKEKGHSLTTYKCVD
jgi:hypothetical protein